MTTELLESELKQLGLMAGPEKAVLIQKRLQSSKARAIALRTTSLAPTDPTALKTPDAPIDPAALKTPDAPIDSTALKTPDAPIDLTALKTPDNLTNTTAPADNTAIYDGLLGGSPLLPAGFVWPCDRAGLPMLFLAQFDLSRLPSTHFNLPPRGFLSVFRSKQILTMPVKDRHSFQIVYLPQFDYADLAQRKVDVDVNLASGSLPAWAILATPAWTVDEQLKDLESLLGLPQTVGDGLRAWAKKFNTLSLGGDSQLFGADLPGLAEQREICAFAASGISYSQARAIDSHYSHLVEEAPQWMLLARFDEDSLFNNCKLSNAGKNIVAQTRILIKREDLALGLFERAWLICLPAGD